METTVSKVISFTENARKEIFKLREQQELDDSIVLKIGVDGGGCAGLSYKLGFDKLKEGEESGVVDIEGIKVFIAKTHLIYLMGMEVDYQHGLDARGFTFSNPNATSTCGCGSSFSV